MKKINCHCVAILLCSLSACASQDENVFQNTIFHDVVHLPKKEFNSAQNVKNIILMIGDGMGIAQVYAGLTANKGQLNLQNCTYTGFIKTNPSDGYITDSAAGATAFACGVKTYNGAIGVDSEGNHVPNILELAKASGKRTGLVATCRITHATPAAFIAHQLQRDMYEEIAADFINTDIDVFIGGGRNNFNQRKDNANYLDTLLNNDYQVIFNIDSLSYIYSGKLAALIHEEDQSRFSEGRGDMLIDATESALRLLSNNENGFFLMIEGSQIDWGGHENLTSYIVEEMLDFDRAIGKVLKFAADNGETLVVITADHETGGFAIINGDLETGMVEGSFSTEGHTPVLIPVFAYGPHAEKFTGIYENTAIFDKMKSAAGL